MRDFLVPRCRFLVAAYLHQNEGFRSVALRDDVKPLDFPAPAQFRRLL